MKENIIFIDVNHVSSGVSLRPLELEKGEFLLKGQIVYIKNNGGVS